MRNYLHRCDREQFRTIRLLLLGAEKLKPELAREIREKFALEPLEGYGCTELTPIVAVNVPEDCAITVEAWPIIPKRSGRTRLIRIFTFRLAVPRRLLDCDVHGSAPNPCRTHLNGDQSFRRIRRHSKVHLVAIHRAGVADRSQDLGEFPIDRYVHW